MAAQPALPQHPSISKASMILNGRLNFRGCTQQMIVVACTADFASVSTRETSETELLLLTDAIRRHAGSSMHKTAVLLECERLASEKTGGIIQAFSEAASTERKTALGLGAMKCLYWLAKNEIAHTTKYVLLLQLALDLGCTYFTDLRQGANATYTSERIIQEFLSTLASQIESNQISQFQFSSYVALMCDETTDISVLKQMVIYGR